MNGESMMAKTIIKRIESTNKGVLISQKTHFAEKKGGKYWLSDSCYVEECNINRNIFLQNSTIRWEIAGESETE
ncbi:hypothetical protein DEEACLCL_00014 [Salmonella phage CRW-SP2]|nr:hypothetical protein DEEACLCL_00014 [Salmonella phage CRW-SP2]